VGANIELLFTLTKYLMKKYRSGSGREVPARGVCKAGDSLMAQGSIPPRELKAGICRKFFDSGVPD